MKRDLLGVLGLYAAAALFLVCGVAVKGFRTKEAPEPKEAFFLEHFKGTWNDYLQRENAEKLQNLELGQEFNKYLASFDQYKDLPLLEKARAVDAIIDVEMTYTPDASKCNFDDYWETPVSTWKDMTGDCEGYATFKYKVMKDMGVPDDQLGVLFIPGRASTPGHAATPGHAVTLVRDISGKDTVDYILDNQRQLFVVKHEAPILSWNDTLCLKDYVAAGYKIDTLSYGRAPMLSDSGYDPVIVMNMSGARVYKRPVSASDGRGFQTASASARADKRPDPPLKR